MSNTDIVGYTYNTENLCPNCLRDVVVHWRNADATLPVEALLDALAAEVGINRYDERTYDSGRFPKVIFDSQVEDDSELCGNCHEPLIA